MLQIFAILAVALAGQWADCDFEKDVNPGSYGPATFFNTTVNGSVLYGLLPQGDGPFPIVGYNHGGTGQYGMYNDTLNLWASHGFLVVFPFIKNPEADKKIWTTNNDGKYLVQAINWATAQNSVPDSQLFGKVDTSNIVFSGHSMGATCSINGSFSQLNINPNIKLTVAQHPGVCGPFGPPPLPATWTTHKLKEISSKHPVFFTTAHNDSAFWPKPYTEKHEYGCWSSSMSSNDNTSVFVSWADEVCTEDQGSAPFPDGGHNCPLKRPKGGKPEMPWVLVALKLYAQQDGSVDSKCYDLLWGESDDSLRKSTWTNLVDFRGSLISPNDQNQANTELLRMD